MPRSQPFSLCLGAGARGLTPVHVWVHVCRPEGWSPGTMLPGDPPFSEGGGLLGSMKDADGGRCHQEGTVPAGLPLGLEGEGVQESHNGALSWMWLSAGLSPLACINGG